MTLFIAYTILMTVLSVMNGIFTYRIFKQLEMGDNMGKNKKAFKKAKELTGVSVGASKEAFEKNFGEVADVKEEFDGSFSNPFADRELDYLLRQSAPKSAEEFVSQNEVEKQFIPIDGTVASKEAKADSSDSGIVNIPIITDGYDVPEDDERMLNRLLFLSDYLNGKYKPNSGISEQEFEDMKWETVNETYCLITVDLPRKKAEIVRKYFRRLDTTYARQDGTYYSKVTKGELAKEVIDDLIEVYPWYEVDNDGVKVNWDGLRKTNTNVIKLNPRDNSEEKVYADRLKYAIGNLSKSVEKLNEILSGK